MKIINVNSGNRTFEEIKVGDVFKFGDKNNVFMKINPIYSPNMSEIVVNAVALSTGTPALFKSDYEVILQDAVLKICNLTK